MDCVRICFDVHLEIWIFREVVAIQAKNMHNPQPESFGFLAKDLVNQFHVQGQILNGVASFGAIRC